MLSVGISPCWFKKNIFDMSIIILNTTAINVVFDNKISILFKIMLIKFLNPKIPLPSDVMRCQVWDWHLFFIFIIGRRQNYCSCTLCTNINEWDLQMRIAVALSFVVRHNDRQSDGILQNSERPFLTMARNIPLVLVALSCGPCNTTDANLHKWTASWGPFSILILKTLPKPER